MEKFRGEDVVDCSCIERIEEGEKEFDRTSFDDMRSVMTQLAEIRRAEKFRERTSWTAVT